MAHFAKLDENNKVIQIVVVDNSVLLDDNGEEQETLGVSHLANLFDYTNWKQTSYNSNFRRRFAMVNGYYIPETDIFTYPKPYPSFVVNTQTGTWVAPVPIPDYNPETHGLVWDEENQNWIILLKAG